MEIHELDLTGLLDALNRGTLSSLEIVDALLARSEEINPKIRAIVVPFSDIRDQAKKADASRARGHRAGPLHGAPVTVKESLDVAGYDSTMGFASLQGQPAEQDAVVVEGVREAGALLLGKTNVPQTLLSPLETTNYLWGTTNNPWNMARTPFGSSGGEAAGLAAGLSPAGIGTDVGGSIRLPAAACGVSGLKPTGHRWSNRGAASAVPGQEFIVAQTGPMARSVRDLRLLFETVCKTNAVRRDPRVVPLASAEGKPLSELRVGVYSYDGWLRPSAAVVRAVHEAERALEQCGVRTVPFSPPNVEELIALHFSALSADGARGVMDRVGDDDLIEPLRLTRQVTRLPQAVRQLAARGLRLAGERRVATVLGSLSEKTVAEFWALTHHRNALAWQEQRAWDDAEIDAVLCPVQMTPAIPHGMGKDFIVSFAYAARYNMLNLPAGTVPVSCVRPGEEAREMVEDRIDRRAATVDEGSEGLPVGVQVVGRPWREDIVLGLMEAIEEYCRAHPDFPKTPIFPAESSQ